MGFADWKPRSPAKPVATQAATAKLAKAADATPAKAVKTDFGKWSPRPRPASPVSATPTAIPGPPSQKSPSQKSPGPQKQSPRSSSSKPAAPASPVKPKGKGANAFSRFMGKSDAPALPPVARSGEGLGADEVLKAWDAPPGAILLPAGLPPAPGSGYDAWLSWVLSGDLEEDAARELAFRIWECGPASGLYDALAEQFRTDLEAAGLTAEATEEVLRRAWLRISLEQTLEAMDDLRRQATPPPAAAAAAVPTP